MEMSKNGLVIIVNERYHEKVIVTIKSEGKEAGNFLTRANVRPILDELGMTSSPYELNSKCLQTESELRSSFQNEDYNKEEVEKSIKRTMEEKPYCIVAVEIENDEEEEEKAKKINKMGRLYQRLQAIIHEQIERNLINKTQVITRLSMLTDLSGYDLYRD